MGAGTVSTVVTAVFAVFAGLAANNLIMKKEKPYLYCKIGASGAFLVLALVCAMESGGSLWLGFLPGYVLCAAGDILLPISGEIRPALEPVGKKKSSKYKKNAEPAEPAYRMPPLRQPWFAAGVGVFAAAHVIYILQFGRILQWKISPVWFMAAAAVLAYTVWTTRSSQYDYQGHGLICTAYSVVIGLFGGMGIDLLIRSLTSGGDGLYGGEGTLMLAAGAICFMVSDGLLAMNYFKKKVWWMLGLPVMLFYYGAMYFLTTFTLYA